MEHVDGDLEMSTPDWLRIGVSHMFIEFIY
jgi:hypothetical protein